MNSNNNSNNKKYNEKKYYVLVPIENVTLDMIKEAATSKGAMTFTLDELHELTDEVRIITDYDALPDQSYGVLTFKMNYPSTVSGYKKYTLDDITIELAKSKWDDD